MNSDLIFLICRTVIHFIDYKKRTPNFLKQAFTRLVGYVTSRACTEKIAKIYLLNTKKPTYNCSFG